MKWLRFSFRTVCVIILVLAVLQVLNLGNESRAENPPAPEGDDLHTINKDLEEKRIVIEEKSRKLEEQETRIEKQNQELEKKLKDLERVRAEITGELEKDRKNNEERVSKMVTVFETMTPKSAAGILETLDDFLAVEILKRMDPKKVAKVMNIMEKARSAKLSELLTGYYRPEAHVKSVSQSLAPEKPEGTDAAKAPSSPPTGQEVAPAAGRTTASSAVNSKKGGNQK